MTPTAHISVIDCHVHVRGPDGLANLAAIADQASLSASNVLCCPLLGQENALGLLHKTKNPHSVYVFGGLRYPPAAGLGKVDSFATQASRLIEAGCDGIKMIEGKPDTARQIGLPLDHHRYLELYAYLQENRIPLLMHVADPASFWHADRIPDWALKYGWFYGDGTYPARQQQYDQVDNILEKFPALRLILAHFYFLSDDHDRADRFLQAHPSVSFDLTPGEMFGDFAKDPPLWRQFLVKHQDRILFGTDNYGGHRGPNPERVKTGVDRIAWMRGKLESPLPTGRVEADPWGLALPPAVLEKIYLRNFHRYAGPTPKPVDLPKALAECDCAIHSAKASPDSHELTADLEAISARLRALKAEGC